jgi:hypothetical protein
MGDAGVLALGSVRSAWAVGLGACVALLSVGSSCSSRSGGDELPSNVPPPNGGSAGSGGSGGARIDAPPPPPVGAAGGEKSVVVTVSTGGKPVVVANTGGSGSVSGAGGAGGASGAGGAGSLCQPPALVAPGCVQALESESLVALCNGSDDDCDGSVDEGCKCEPGSVQPCFLGEPGRRHVGACVDGEQVCVRNGELETRWGECKGGILPKPEACDTLDNDCNGCVDDFDDCKPTGSCPGPGDPRIPTGQPLAPYPLRGRDFFMGDATGWSWTVVGGPCDALNASSPSFVLSDASAETATLTPKLSGDYTVTMTVTLPDGSLFTCTWIVHIQGPGLRVEMCYPESSTQDLDLYLKQPGKTTPWFTGEAQFSTSLDQCCWANCEANLRGDSVMPAPVQPVTRADWGYPTSPLALCEGGPQGPSWQGVGFCASPRLDIDNNLQEGTGLPENINVDAPREGETFRIMVANFTGALSHPLVNVYCDGHRAATIGAAPDQVPNFSGTSGSISIGALWRVADVTTHVTGTQTSCTVSVLHAPASPTAFDVTYDDPRF